MTTTTKQIRADRLLPNGIPRYVRCYDLPEYAERYTIVFTGKYRKNFYQDFIHLGMSAHPFHPWGIAQHGGSQTQIDRPTYSHLGKPIKFTDLPDDCQRCALPYVPIVIFGGYHNNN